MTELCLGTVQFGLNYGIQGNDQPDLSKALDILNTANSAGIYNYDTAATYGTAEDVFPIVFSNPQIDKTKI